MMKKIYEKVEPVINTEYRESNKNSPMFNSPHEGYAVVAEEYDEMVVEHKCIEELMDYFWEYVKRNDDKAVQDRVESIEHRAHLMACEAIQLSAMCRKYLESSKKWYVGSKS